MFIILHVAERGAEHKISHDLNFQKTKYEVLHTINFPTNKPGLLRLLAESGPVPEKKGSGAGSSKSSATATSSSPAANNNTSIDSSNNNSHSNNNGTIDGAGSPVSAGAKRKQSNSTAGNTSATSTAAGAGGAAAGTAAGGEENSGAKFKKKPKIEKGSVDLERLAEGLKMLGEDDLMGVVQMVTDNLTPEMYIKNDVKEGEFHMDLYTLPDSLLKSLWDYVKKRVTI